MAPPADKDINLLEAKTTSPGAIFRRFLQVLRQPGEGKAVSAPFCVAPALPRRLDGV